MTKDERVEELGGSRESVGKLAVDYMTPEEIEARYVDSVLPRIATESYWREKIAEELEAVEINFDGLRASKTQTIKSHFVAIARGSR